MYKTMIWFRLAFHIIFLKSEPNLWIRKPIMEKSLVLHLCISIHQGNYYYIDSFPERSYYGESWYIVYNTGQFFIWWRPFKRFIILKTCDHITTYRDIWGKHDLTPERFLSKPFLTPQFFKSSSFHVIYKTCGIV